MLPAASRARALRVCGPLSPCRWLPTKPNTGRSVSSAPSVHTVELESDAATPTLSVALAETVTVPSRWRPVSRRRQADSRWVSCRSVGD